MATMNSNNAYLSWDGVAIQGFWTDEISHEVSVETEDITTGAGATHVARAPKLIDRTMDFVIAYDDVALATYVHKLKPGMVATLIWGPEGNASGKPRFEGLMVLTGNTLAQTIDKAKLAFELSFEQAAAPVATIEDGSTFA